MSALDTALFRRRLDDERRAVLEAIENIHHENPGSLSDEAHRPPKFLKNFGQHPAEAASSLTAKRTSMTRYVQAFKN